MDKIKRKQKTQLNPSILTEINNNKENSISKKLVTFRCDSYLVEKIRNALTSKKLAGDYQHPNFSAIIRQALQSYQNGMKLTYQRKDNPKKEISFRLDEKLGNFYHNLPPRSRTEILERVLGSYIDSELI